MMQRYISNRKQENEREREKEKRERRKRQRITDRERVGWYDFYQERLEYTKKKNTMKMPDYKIDFKNLVSIHLS